MPSTEHFLLPVACLYFLLLLLLKRLNGSQTSGATLFEHDSTTPRAVQKSSVPAYTATL